MYARLYVMWSKLSTLSQWLHFWIAFIVCPQFIHSQADRPIITIHAFPLSIHSLSTIYLLTHNAGVYLQNSVHQTQTHPSRHFILLFLYAADCKYHLSYKRDIYKTTIHWDRLHLNDFYLTLSCCFCCCWCCCCAIYFKGAMAYCGDLDIKTEKVREREIEKCRFSKQNGFAPTRLSSFRNILWHIQNDWLLRNGIRVVFSKQKLTCR